MADGTVNYSGETDIVSVGTAANNMIGCRLSDTKFVVLWYEPKTGEINGQVVMGAVIEISGSSITIHTPTQVVDVDYATGGDMFQFPNQLHVVPVGTVGILIGYNMEWSPSLAFYTTFGFGATYTGPQPRDAYVNVLDVTGTTIVQHNAPMLLPVLPNSLGDDAGYMYDLVAFSEDHPLLGLDPGYTVSPGLVAYFDGSDTAGDIYHFLFLYIHVDTWTITAGNVTSSFASFAANPETRQWLHAFEDPLAFTTRFSGYGIHASGNPYTDWFMFMEVTDSTSGGPTVPSPHGAWLFTGSVQIQTLMRDPTDGTVWIATYTSGSSFGSEFSYEEYDGDGGGAVDDTVGIVYRAGAVSSQGAALNLWWSSGFNGLWYDLISTDLTWIKKTRDSVDSAARGAQFFPFDYNTRSTSTGFSNFGGALIGRLESPDRGVHRFGVVLMYFDPVNGWAIRAGIASATFPPRGLAPLRQRQRGDMQAARVGAGARNQPSTVQGTIRVAGRNGPV